jgi:hypothetical protein
MLTSDTDKGGKRTNIPVPNPSATTAQDVIRSVNQFRLAKGLPGLAWSNDLYVDAYVAAYLDVEGSPNGAKMTHYFLGSSQARSQAQVIAPGIDNQNICHRNMGGYTPFEFALSGWLCEVPSDLAIGHDCNAVGKLNHLIVGGPDKGHWEIFSNPVYKYIGCAYSPFTQGHGQCDTFTGFWFCNFGGD